MSDTDTGRPTRGQVDATLRTAYDAGRAAMEALPDTALDQAGAWEPALEALADLASVLEPPHDEVASAIVAALAARTPQPAEPSTLVLAAEEACAAIERLNPDATEGTPIWDDGPDGEQFPDEVRRLFEAGDALMREIDRAMESAAPQVADQSAPYPPADPHLAHYLSLPTHDLTGLRDTLIEGKGNAALLSAVEQEIARRDRQVAPLPAVPDGAGLIAAERLRQVSKEGWTARHDAGHTGDELVRAAISYLQAPRRPRGATGPPGTWPWSAEAWKPGDRVRELAKAGALIAAEIDRLRSSPPAVPDALPT